MRTPILAAGRAAASSRASTAARVQPAAPPMSQQNSVTLTRHSSSTRALKGRMAAVMPSSTSGIMSSFPAK